MSNESDQHQDRREIEAQEARALKLQGARDLANRLCELAKENDVVDEEEITLEFFRLLDDYTKGPGPLAQGASHV